MQKIRQTEMLSALDRVLARDIISQIDVPEHDNSAMDGYAFHSINLHHEADAAKLVVNRRLAGEDLKFGMLQRLGCDNHRHGRDCGEPRRQRAVAACGVVAGGGVFRDQITQSNERLRLCLSGP